MIYASRNSHARSSLVTCGADNTVRLFSGYDDEDATTIDKHNAEVTSLTVSLNHFATGSADHQVQVDRHIIPPHKISTMLTRASQVFTSKGEFEALATRFTAPVRSVAFNVTGTMLAAGAEYVL